MLYTFEGLKKLAFFSIATTRVEWRMVSYPNGTWVSTHPSGNWTEPPRWEEESHLYRGTFRKCQIYRPPKGARNKFFLANNRLSFTNCYRVYICVLALKTSFWYQNQENYFPVAICPALKTLKKRVIVSLPLKLQDTNWYVERGEYSVCTRASLQI